jgi:hypothetical protein
MATDSHGLFMATRADDAIEILTPDGKTARAHVAIPRLANKASTEPYAIAVSDGALWVSTREKSGDAGVLRMVLTDRTLTDRSWRSVTAVDSFDADEMELAAADGVVWAITSSTPHYLFRFEDGGAVFLKLSGHDIADVGCLARAAAVSRVSVRGLTCDFVPSELTARGFVLATVPRLRRLPESFDPATWDTTAATTQGERMVVGMTRRVRTSDGNFELDRGSVLRYGEDEQWHELMSLPKTSVLQVATTARFAVALIEDREHQRDVLLLRW